MTENVDEYVGILMMASGGLEASAYRCPASLMKIVGQMGILVAEGETGELWLKGLERFPRDIGNAKRRRELLSWMDWFQDWRHRIVQSAGWLYHAQRAQE